MAKQVVSIARYLALLPSSAVYISPVALLLSQILAFPDQLCLNRHMFSQANAKINNCRDGMMRMRSWVLYDVDN